MIVSNLSSYLPLFINVEGLKVLVVGGGKVGTKRALKFAESKAIVYVVSLEFKDENELRLFDNIHLIKNDARYLPENFLSRFNIIVVATNDKELNERICETCKKLGKLCNNPTNPDSSNFIVPIYGIEKGVGIAITTFGKSSLTSKYLLDLIRSNILKENIFSLVDTMGKVKEILKLNVTEPSISFMFYSKIFYDDKFRYYVDRGEIDLAIQRAREIIYGR
ncbi:precorrin-2 dehydrogenase/sirohydrochlorin ferrochelatase family protein [Sulfolobus acidocaldarius]|uniref:precorrin-2 dehydrogenase/sirohydrochlorin ferrochelatase family protein n=1 Tax=Sulfolobus acidocaldarius TaxID=2285 RepID=UPI000B5A6A5A|nr:NAD(P)-dependent oxidoreductase [Sulfolobus acidocaldarius]